MNIFTLSFLTIKEDKNYQRLVNASKETNHCNDIFDEKTQAIY